jgi:hypothetical protein
MSATAMAAAAVNRLNVMVVSLVVDPVLGLAGYQ